MVPRLDEINIRLSFHNKYTVIRFEIIDRSWIRMLVTPLKGRFNVKLNEGQLTAALR